MNMPQLITVTLLETEGLGRTNTNNYGCMQYEILQLHVVDHTKISEQLGQSHAFQQLHQIDYCLQFYSYVKAVTRTDISVRGPL